MLGMEARYQVLVEDARDAMVIIGPDGISELVNAQTEALHTNCYISKPVDLDGFLKVIKSIDNFWLAIVKLPHEPRS